MKNLREIICDPLWSRSFNIVLFQLEDNVRSQIYNQIYDQVWEQIWHQIANSIWDQIWDYKLIIKDYEKFKK